MKIQKLNGLVSVLSIAVALVLTVSSVSTLANTAPEPAFTAWRVEGKGETVVGFDASSSSDPDGAIAVYQWTFGDRSSGSGMTVEHTYPSVGTYEVTLVVIDDGGAAGILTKEIDIAQLLTSPHTGEAEPAVAPANVPIGTGVGERAPEFTLIDFDGQSVHLSDFLGKVVLIEFWRRTCPHCVASTPYLEELRQAFAEEDFVVILIVLDYNPAEAERYLTENGFTDLLALREPVSSERKTAETYRITNVPRAFLIDKTGVIRYYGAPDDLSEETIAPWL